MTDRLTPSPEARSRIQQLSRKELQAFFDEVPAPAMRSLALYLPPVDGFRRGSPAGIIKQKEALARRLSRPAANEHDYNALYMVWRTWIDETQPNAPLIQTLIDELEEAAENTDDPDARRLVIEQHTDSLLRKLKEESEENRSPREAIERLYTFSPLPETAAARGIIAAAKLAADVERDAKYRNLPTRLEQDERELQSVKAELATLADRVAAIAEESAKALRELPGLRDAVRKARSSADAAHAAVNEQVHAKAAHDRDEAKRAAAEARIKTLADDLGALRKSVGELASNLDQLKPVAEEVRKLGETQTQSTKEQKQHIAEALEHIRRDVEALLEDRTQEDRFALLAEEMVDLTRRVGAVAAQSQPPNPAKDLVRPPASISSALHCASLPTPSAAVAISSYAGLAPAFANALLSLGLRNNGAQLLAEECAAAIAARQAVFLQGAFASRVARALTAATGGAASACFAMPIGLQGGAPFRLAIEEAFVSLGDGVGGLAIEGFNHAPLDITREVIADCVRPATLSNALYRRIAVFATLSRGVAALSIEPEIFELGPVFDLDYLDWRTNPAEAPALQASFLPAKTDQALSAQVAGANANAEEAVRLAKALVSKRSPAVERSVARAYQALHVFRSDQKTVTPLHSLFYGWLLPYWRALGLSREKVDSEFDKGKVHGAPADGRLTAMFAAEFPDSTKDGAP
jgi:chemotaxis protein histidine kinase CheA